MKKECRLCKSKKLSVFLSLKDFKLLKCSSCQIIFIDPFPSATLQKEANRELYGRQMVQKEYWKKLPQLKRRVKKAVTELQKFKKDGKLLDVGCGFGLFLEMAKEAGFKVYGVEMEKETVKAVQEKFGLKNIYQKNIKEIGFPERYFDVITLFDILEHLENPEVILKELKKLLKPNGVLVVQSPNIKSIMFKLTKEKWNWLLFPNHLYHFTPKSLASLLNDSGYKIIYRKTFDDISEFNYNLLDAWNIKKSRGIIYKIIWKAIRESRFLLFLPSFIYSKLGFGGLVRIYAGHLKTFKSEEVYTSLT